MRRRQKSPLKKYIIWAVLISIITLMFWTLPPVVKKAEKIIENPAVIK